MRRSLAAVLAVGLVAPVLAAEKPRPKVQVAEEGSGKSKAPKVGGVPVGTLAFAAGLVERSKGGKWSRLKAGDTVRTGDRIRTGVDGLARLKLPWMTVTTAPSSIVTFPAEVVLSTELEAGRVEMNAQSGQIVKVRSAGVEVRGAGWVVIRRTASATGVQVMALEGSFRLLNEDGAATLLAGSGTTVRAKGAADAPTLLPRPPKGLVPTRDPAYTRAGAPLRFSWEGTAVAHHLQVLPLDSEEPVLVRDVGAPPVDLPLALLGTYRWRVTARDEQGFEGAPSDEGLVCVVDR